MGEWQTKFNVSPGLGPSRPDLGPGLGFELDNLVYSQGPGLCPLSLDLLDLTWSRLGT